MNMIQMVKEFINTAREFEKKKNIDAMIQSLQILSATDDLTIYNTASLEAAEFYSILHDLLICPVTEPELKWCIVKVLKVALCNHNARSALVHTYYFIHPLTTLLDANLTSERKLVILRIIQELSYGVVIHWQEAYLPKLIGVLLDIITGNENELVPIALGVIVNLCHKNKPVVHTLMNCVDIKAFLRTILNLQRDNVEISVQVCKLLMILDDLSSRIPNEDILTFVQVSFLRIIKAFNTGNTSLMCHIVDFFHDAKESEHGRKVLLTYPKYPEEINNIINTLNMKVDSGNWQCVEQLMKFVHQLVDLEMMPMITLFTQLTESVMPWVKVEGLAPTVLELMSAMIHQSRNKDDDIYKGVCSCIKGHLQTLIDMLNNMCSTELNTIGAHNILKSLFCLFRELAANPMLSTTIASNIDKEELKKLFLPLMAQNSIDESHLFQQSITSLYVEVLSFISELSLDDREWLFLYLDLLQKKQIIKALALALYSGTFEVKKQVLFLAGSTSFSKDCLTMLSKCLADLNPLFLFNPNPINQTFNKSISCLQSQLDFSPPLTKTQVDSLDRLIEKFNCIFKKDQVKDISLAGVIELYNHRLTEMCRAEKSLQDSLFAADNHRTQLSHRVARLNSEINRFQQLLYSGQQTIESSQMELIKVREQVHFAQEAANSSHVKIKQLRHDIESKNLTIKEQYDEISRIQKINEEHIKKCEKLTENISNLTEKMEDQSTVIQRLEHNNSNLQKEKSDLKTMYSKIQNKLECCEQTGLEKDALVSSKNGHIKTLEQEIAHHQSRIKGLEKSMKEKEKEITAQQNQLVDLERMRKIIFEITGGKKSNL